VTLTIDLWPWKSIGFQTLLRTTYVPSLVKIHWRILILVFTRMLCGKNLTRWPWSLTLKINRIPDSRKHYLCTKIGQNPLTDVDSRVFTRMWRTDGRTDGSVTISHRNFVGEGIIKLLWSMVILKYTDWNTTIARKHGTCSWNISVK
jgi:hypothetical protein